MKYIPIQVITSSSVETHHRKPRISSGGKVIVRFQYQNYPVNNGNMIFVK